MKRFYTMVALTAAMSFGVARAATVGSCVATPNSQQTCTFIEDFDGTGEQNIVVTSVYEPDLPIGNIYLHEPGQAANDASDILQFTNSGAAPLGFADTFTLISDPDDESLGLTIPNGTPANAIIEEAPAGQFTTFTVQTDPGANGGQVFTDTFQIESDPTPEPATMLLFGAGLVGVGFAARRKAA
jgi:hypothetical protein